MDGAPWSEELLDYLAADFVDNGYDVKKLLRLIATSQIYQTRCVPPPEAGSADTPAFSGPIVRRLTAEQFIDAVWRITGTAPNKSDSGDAKKITGTFDARGNEPVRAAIMKSDLLMRSLGRPNREQVVTTRPEDLSTLQALDLTNGPTMANLLCPRCGELAKKLSGPIAGRHDSMALPRNAVSKTDDRRVENRPTNNRRSDDRRRFGRFAVVFVRVAGVSIGGMNL